MAYRVRTDAFEGPFDLLLYLVNQKKVDIGSISISQIADQYLEEVGRMEGLDLEVASDFLYVAATLLEIKAHSLIPRDRDELEEEIVELSPLEARDMLINRLIEYKKFKNAASELNERYASEGRMHPRPFGPDGRFLGLLPDFLKGVTLDSLGLLAANAMARREAFLLEAEHIAAKPIPVEVHVRAIHARIASRKHLRFSELIASDSRPEMVVVTFLAILELYKRRMVHLTQDVAFGDIEVDYIQDSGELDLTGQDELTSVGSE